MNDQATKRLWAFLAISMLIHWVFALTPFLDHFAMITAPPASPKTFEVIPIEESWLKQLRTVGIKDGRKEFSQKVEPAGALSLSQLAAPRTPPNPSKKQNNKSENEDNNKSAKMLDIKEYNAAMSVIRKNAQSQERRHEVNRMVLKDLAANQDNSHAIKNNGFDVIFEPPEGVSEDELNAMEKVFYSFQKRTFESYMHAFLDAYRKVALSRPRLSKELPRDKQTLTGKITFDRNGDVVATKILRWSNDDDIQKLFDETLLNIRALPNPPRALLEKREEFSIYYQLYIN
jgi:hypothetical protein